MPDEPSQCPRCGLTLSADSKPPLSPESGTMTVVHHPVVPEAPNSGLERIGRFEVRRLLGEGSFGRVYEAYDPVMKRVVALKVAKHGEDERLVERFLREARAAGLLTHPHIVAVFDSGSDGPLHYIASAFVQGRTLPEEKTEPRRAAEIVRKLAEALAYAHTQGVVHRDVKPSNVMLREDGDPLLTDFGLAARADEGKMTVAGQVLGTPAYMAPEQWRGQATAASDQYALGCVLVELLTGRTPFGQGDLSHHMTMHATSQVPSMPGVPRDLETITRKCLEKEEGRRYATCQDLADDLGRWLRGEPTKARPVGVMGRLARWTRREPGTASLVTAIAVLLLGGTLTAWGLAAWALEQKERADWEAEEKGKETLVARQAEKKAKENEALAKNNEALAKKRQQEAEFQALKVEDARHANQISLAMRAWEQHDVAEAERILAEVAPRLEGTWETRHLRSLCRRKLLPLLEGESTVVCVSWSPDGEQVLAGCQDGTARGWDARTGRQRFSFRCAPGPDATPSDGGMIYHWSLAWSPDGKRIVGGVGGMTNKVWDATGKDLFSLKGCRGGGARFSPEGKRVACWGKGQTLEVRDAQSGQELLVLTGYYGCVCFSPDGKRIAGVGKDHALKVWDAQTRQELISLKGHAKTVHCVAFSPDGRRLASASEDDTARIWDVETGQEQLSLKGHASSVYDVSFSPDGRLVATASLDNTARVWDALTGQERRTLKGHASSVSRVAFSPDGKHIASASHDETVKVWDARTGRRKLSFKSVGGNVECVAYSPDGKRIASGSFDGTVMVRDARTGWGLLELTGSGAQNEAREPLPPSGRCLISGNGDETARVRDALAGQERLPRKGHAEMVTSLSFSPDGKRIASASADKTARVWDAHTGQEIISFMGHSHWVSSVAFSPDGKQVATASDDKSVRVWDAQTGQEKLSLTDHTERVTSVAFSPDGKLLASASADMTARVWDAETGKELFVLKGHTAEVLAVCFNHDGTRIASASHDRTVKLWNAQTGQEKYSLKGHSDSVTSVCFSNDGNRILTGSRDATINVWDTVSFWDLFPLQGHTGLVLGSIWSPDGNFLASWSKDRTVKVWEMRTGQEALTLKGHAEPVRIAAYSPDGNRLATAGDDRTLKVWELRTGAETLSLAAQDAGVSEMAWTPDGRHLLGWSEDKNLKVWHARTGKELLSLVGYQGRVSALVFSPDGKRALGFAPDGTVKVWDAETFQERLSLKSHGGRIERAVWSPNGKRIASCGADKTVKEWDVETGKVTHSLHWRFKNRVLSVGYSPDGKRLTGKGKLVEMHWDAETGRLKGWKETSIAMVDLDGVVQVDQLPDVVKAQENGSFARKPASRPPALERGNDLILSPPPPHLIAARRSLRRQSDVFWHAAQADDAEKAKQWPAAAFHLERLHRSDLAVAPRLHAALKHTDDTPLTQSIRLNLRATEAARVAAVVGHASLSLLPLLPTEPPGGK